MQLHWLRSSSKHPGLQLLPVYLLALELLNQVPEAALLVFQPLPLPQHTLQLLPQVADEVLEHGLQVPPGCWEDILLQQLPLGGQHLVLLLQEPDLWKREMQESCNSLMFQAKLLWVSPLPKGKSRTKISNANG